MSQDHRSPDTGAMLDEAAREARALAIATEIVVPLRSEVAGDRPLTMGHAATVAIQSLDRAVMVLDMLGDDIACAELVARLDSIDTKLRRRRFALNMRLGLVHLPGLQAEKAEDSSTTNGEAS